MKRVLITGSSGFIGSHLVEAMTDFEIYQWDRNQGDLKLPQDFPEVDIVIHLAAFNSTKDFYLKGFDVIRDNILTTLNLLEHYRNQETKPLFIYTGTPEAITGATDYFGYKIPTDEECPAVIDDVKNIRWSYAGSKLLGEQSVVASGLDYVIIRPNNIYGPRQKNHFVDEFIDRLRNGDRELYGWQNTRSWLYIDDFVNAFTQLIFKEEAKNDIFNIGSNDETEVIVLAEKIAELLDINPSEIVRKDAPEGSAKRRMPDITKLKNITGWEPKINLEDGLAKTVRWHLELK